MDILTIKTISALVYMPAWNYVLIAAGLAVAWRGRRSGVYVALFGFVPMVIFSFAGVVTPLRYSLQTHPPLSVQQLIESDAQAIVIMGGGRYPNAPEYGNRDTVSEETWTRIRYGARVHKLTGLPLLVTGGSVNGESLSEGQVMREALEADLAVPVRWVESRARNSAENAIYSYELLAKEGIKRIILVTHSYHMTRSVEMFEHVGFDVVPAGTQFMAQGDGDYGYVDAIPSAGHLWATRVVLHEYLGRLWYLLNYR